MMCSWRFVAVGLAMLAMDGSASGAATNAMARAISFSGQVHVFCADQTGASVLATFCEDFRAKLVKRVGDEGPWRAPIAVAVRQRPADSLLPMPGETGRLRSSVVTVSGFLRFQIDMEVPPPVDRDEFVRMLAGTLLSEMANRSLGKVAPGQPLARVPSWLVWGLVNRVTDGARAESLRKVKQAVEDGTLPTYAEFMESDGSRGDVALYRACCELLVEALETQLNGREKMRRFVFGLKPGQSWQATLCEVFGGGFGYKPGLERWWALFASRAAGMIVPQTQTWTETRQRLEEALRVEDAELAGALSTGRLPEEFLKRYTHDQARLMDLLIPVQMRVLGLAPLAHPLYRPAIGAYLESFSALGKKVRAQEDAWDKTKAWFEKLGGADGRRMRRFQSALEKATAERRRADEGGEAMARYVGSVEASSHPEDLAGRFSNLIQSSPSGGADARKPATPAGEYLDKVESGLSP